MSCVVTVTNLQCTTARFARLRLEPIYVHESMTMLLLLIGLSSETRRFSQANLAPRRRPIVIQARMVDRML